MENSKTRRRLPSLFRWVLWVLLIQFLLINISAAFYANRLTRFYDSPVNGEPERSKNIFTKTWQLFAGPRYQKSVIREKPVYPYETVSFTTAKGIPIEAWYAKQDSAAKGTVILFHSLSINKSRILEEASEFRFLGYNIMLVDFRGHGNSGGNTTTLGIRESEEVKLAWDWIVQKGEKKIFLWGSSMGAVVVAKAIHDYSLQPTGAILEMPFASMQSHFRGRARALGFEGLPEKPFGFLVTFWTGIERGVRGFRHRTTRYVTNIHCPLLLQWGSLDQYVTREETNKVFEAIASKEKRLVIYDRSAHQSLLGNEPGKWKTEVGKFLGETNH
ncbi:MAG TPA: alpha/beta hydrolase [Chitinophagaceae bacterium]|nr:alpha/beta hydrolase [Chitinophagaceae bacterium]